MENNFVLSSIQKSFKKWIQNIGLLILSLIAIPIGFFGSKQQKSLAIYPQIRINDWTSHSLFVPAPNSFSAPLSIAEMTNY